MSSKSLLAPFVFLGLATVTASLLVTAPGSATRLDAPAGCQQPGPVGPALYQEILAAREAVWRAWFANDRARLEAVIPEETIAINAGEERWQNRAEILAAAEEFVAGGWKLVRLEYPRTEIQLYGDVAILYTTYLFEVENQGERQTSSGRGTEIFVRRDGRWVNSGWHLDSGR